MNIAREGTRDDHIVGEYVPPKVQKQRDYGAAESQMRGIKEWIMTNK